MNRKWTALFLSAIMVTGLFAGCGMALNAQAKPMNSSKLFDSLQDTKEADSLDAEYVKGLNSFAYQLFDKLRGDENVFVSPYSISMALSMLYNGTDGESRKEIAKLLGYDKLKDYTGEYSEAANQYMNSNSKYIIDALQKIDPKVQIDVANSIWLADNTKFNDTIEQTLLAPVRNYYSADIFKVDFTKDKTLDNLNSWVSKHTNKMIDPFLNEFSNKDMLRLFLVNAIYFNGKWSTPFSPDDTHKQVFYGLNSESSIDMMYLYDYDYRYYCDNGMKAIEIPYGNGSVVMDVFLPEDTQDATIGEVYGSLKNNQINEFIEKLDQSETEKITTLALPKFEMEYGIKVLNDALQELGMEAPFNPDPSDLSLIGDNLFVSQVVHKAKIQVEEWGTKASAATGISVDTTAARIDEESIEFIVDVPFLFLIRDKVSDTILFMGEIDQLN